MLYFEELGDDKVLGSDAPSRLAEQSAVFYIQLHPVNTCTLTCVLYSEELGDDEGLMHSVHLGVPSKDAATMYMFVWPWQRVPTR